MAALKVGKAAPGFTLLDMEGKERSLGELLSDGSVLLAFFKVSCPTCQYTFPFLERLHEQPDGSAGRIIGISQDGRKGTAEYNREFGVRFPILLDPADEDYPVSNAYGLTHVPSLFLIEPRGRIVFTSVGFVKADLEEAARRLGAANLFHRDEKIEAFRAG